MKSTSIFEYGGFAGVFFFLFAFTTPAFADTPAIVNIGVTTKGSYVTMDARLVDGFTGKILEAIESGVPMTFTFQIELRKHTSLWADELIRSNTIHHTVQYDSLKKTYRFSEVGKNVNRKIITRKKSQYKQLMSTLRNIPIAPLYRLDPNEKYYVRAKADLEMDRFWFPFNYLFFFVPFNDFETSWTETASVTVVPDPDAPDEDFSGNSGDGSTSKGLNHVIRSFNK